jgi:hypothetical protein
MLEANTGDTVVMLLMDHSIYFGKNKDGGLVLAQRGDDSKYHINEDLEVATRVEVLTMFSPVLEAVREMKVIIATPLLWYSNYG